MEQLEQISITYFLSPHVFWYTKPKLENEEFAEFEEFVQKNMFDFKPLQLLSKTIIVGTYEFKMKKWIRVRVEKIMNDDECITWAIDYGIVAKRDRNDLYYLPERMCTPTFKTIFLGGIHGLVPINKNWSEQALASTERILNEALKVYFVKIDQISSEHQFGDIWIMESGRNVFLLKEHLIANHVGITSVNFVDVMNLIQFDDFNCYKKHVPHHMLVSESISQKNTYREKQVDRMCHWNENDGLDRNIDLVDGLSTNDRFDNIFQNHNASADTSAKTPIDLSAVEPNYIKSKVHLTPLLVHGHVKVKPIESKYTAQFTSTVHFHLKKFSQLYATQAYAWPHITRNNSLILVDSKGWGKTMAYVPAICSLIQRRMEIQQTSNTDPIAVIVAPTMQSVSHIASLCRYFMNQRDIATGVVEAEVNESITKVMCKIYNHCNIFVSTPKVFVKLLESNPLLFKNNGDLDHIVLDNVDVECEKFKIEYQKIYNWQRKMTNVQTVITSRTWQPFLLRCARHIQNPLLIIGHYIEANFYARAQIEIHFEREEDKMQNILNHLKNCNYSNDRTIIVCNDHNAVERLSKYFEERMVPHITFNGQTPITALGGANQWSGESATGRYQVLICTDDIIDDLNLRCAQNVIHFDLPNRFRLFVNRFSLTLDCCHNFIADSETKSKTPRIILLINDTNTNVELPKIIQLLDRYCPNSMPLALRTLAEREKNIKDDSLKTKTTVYHPICNNYVTTGRVECELKCLYRHWLSPLDAPPADYPLKGLVRVQIFHIHSPTHYTGRIICHKSDMQSPWIPVNKSDKFSEFIVKFAAYYQKKEALHSVGNGAHDGDLCVVFYEKGIHRCQIIKRTEKSDFRNGFSLDDDDIVEVRLIDAGSLIKCQLCELYKLDQQFSDFPGQAIDIHLTGVLPTETVWHKSSIDKIRNLLSCEKSESREIEVNVIHALNNSLVIDHMRVLEKLKLSNEYVMLGSIKKIMIQEKYGISDKISLTKFEQALKDRGGLLVDEVAIDESQNGAN